MNYFSVKVKGLYKVSFLFLFKLSGFKDLLFKPVLIKKNILKGMEEEKEGEILLIVTHFPLFINMMCYTEL